MPKYKGTQKKRNRWYYWIWDNRSKQLKWFGGFESAEDAYKERLHKLNDLHNKDIDPTNITFEDFCIYYLRIYGKKELDPGTVLLNKKILTKHVYPHIGHIRLQRLNSAHLLDLIDKLTEKAPPTVPNSAITIIRKILVKAYEWELLHTNPAKKIKKPTLLVKEHPVLTKEKLLEIIDKIPGRNKCIIALGGMVGLRRGEVFGLQWSDFDLKKGLLTLKRQVTRGKVKRLKAKASQATLPLAKDVLPKIKEWKLQSGSPQWVFKGRGDGPLIPDGWASRNWSKIKNRLDLPKEFRFHDLRHTFATVLLKDGVSIAKVQKLMRHASIKTTIDTYGHLVSDDLRDALEIFNSPTLEHSLERSDLNQEI